MRGDLASKGGGGVPSVSPPPDGDWGRPATECKLFSREHEKQMLWNGHLDWGWTLRSFS
jgi:hypothetical protein